MEISDFEEEHAFTDYSDVPELPGKNHVWEKNLIKMGRHQIDKKNKDLIILVVGNPGVGKSAFTFLSEVFLRGGDVDFDKWSYTHDQHTTHFRNNKREVLNYDEGRDSYFRRKAMSKKNTEALNMLFQYRFKNHILFINFQNVSDIEPDLLYDRSHALVRITHQGWFWFFSKKKKDQIKVDSKTKKVSFPDPNFRGAFPDPAEEYPDLWEEYEEDNEEKLEEKSEKEEEHDADPTNWLSTGEFAERIDVADDTIRKWCDKGKLDHRRLPNGDRRIPEDQVDDILN